jgi:hypothetical protein
MASWKRVPSSLRALRHLSRSEGAAALEALAAISVIAVALRLVRFGRVQRAVRRLAARAGARAGAHEDASRLARIFAAVGRRLRFANCLSTSLALSYALQRRGIVCALRFGVRRHDGDLQAHAWLECGALRLDTRPAHDFMPFPAAILPSDTLA